MRTDTRVYAFERSGKGYRAFADGEYVGDVAKGHGGWSSQLPGDPQPSPADSATRLAAAERLLLMAEMRAHRAERNRVAEAPDGYEIVDAAELRRFDTVRLPWKLTDSGQIAAWSTSTRTVCRTEGVRGIVSVSFEFDPEHPLEERWSHIASEGRRQVARRIEDGPRQAPATTGGFHHSSVLGDFDFMSLLDFVHRVRNEHSAEYAFANWTWTFDDPQLNMIGATLPGMQALVASQRFGLEAWDRRCPGRLGFNWIAWRADEVRHREEHAALYAVRRGSDGYFFTVGSAEHAERLRTDTGQYGPFIAYTRREPGGEWIEATGPVTDHTAIEGERG